MLTADIKREQDRLWLWRQLKPDLEHRTETTKMSASQHFQVIWWGATMIIHYVETKPHEPFSHVLQEAWIRTVKSLPLGMTNIRFINFWIFLALMRTWNRRFEMACWWMRAQHLPIATSALLDLWRTEAITYEELLKIIRTEHWCQINSEARRTTYRVRFHRQLG